jgi:hypothetical protein
MKNLYLLPVFVVFFLAAFANEAAAQCSYYPISIDQRVSSSKYIVLGKVIEKTTYIDITTGNVNTLNKLQVNAWLKNYSAIETVYVITLGGVYGNIATQVDPALQLDQQHEYILMLEDDNKQIDDKNFRTQHPQSLQLLTYADAQGCLVNENNVYKDYFDKTVQNEQAIFDKINMLTRQVAKRPTGEMFQSRLPVTPTANRITAITSFSPSPTRGGTIVPGDFITITGSGFGAAAGTVFFTNADDGGATFTATGVASDVTAWSDASITVKVPPNAGTGPINVNGAMTSGSNLTINYNHIAINSNFSGFGSTTRQRYYHRNMNGAGGYNFLYNTTSGFSANAPAVAAFERALSTWRTNTLMNWKSNGTTATGFGLDGVNVIMFDGTLPVGVLGRATSRFSGSATGGCSLANTVWCVNEIDVQFFPDPPTAGFPWEYGPAAPAFTEYDFESVALHELGHAHGLGHVINAGGVMHFALANGSSIRTLNANDIAGGIARVTYSTAATCFNPAAATCGSGPMIAFITLPVRLTSFTGERTGPSTNKLYWTTAQEQNSLGFYIQRSNDGTTFKETGFVASSGNSSVPVDYSFTDNTAGPHAWYYKLRMVDRDGHQDYSSTIFIDGDKTAAWKIWASEQGDKIYLYGNATISDKAHLKLFAANGQQIMVKTINAGSNEISVGYLSRGLYHYQLVYNGKIISGKLFLGGR